MVTDSEKYLRLAQVCNTSFGRSGTLHQHQPTGQNVRVDALSDETLKAKVIMTVQYRSEREVAGRCRGDAVELVKAAVKKLTGDYKAAFPQEAALRLSLDETKFVESFEVTTFNSTNGVFKALYRCEVLLGVL
jgi:hypothetical protein